MKLSTALREGIKKSPKQTFGSPFGDVGNIFDKTTSCALGAISIGMGVSFCELANNEELSEKNFTLWHEIRVRNDSLKMSREDIASWLESRGL